MLLIVTSFNGCTKPNQDEVTKLTKEIEQVKSHINETKKETEKYGEGSTLKAMVVLRLSVQEQTLAMLEQKKKASWYFPKASYTINNKSYSPPENVQELITKLQTELTTARDDWKISQSKAESAGGLIAAIESMQAEMKGLRVAQLEYKLSAYKNGYPSLYPETDLSKLIPSIPLAAEGIEKEAQNSVQGNFAGIPSKEEQELEKMKDSIAVKLINKTYYPSNIEAGRFNDMLDLKLQYTNKSEKDIRAFTGYTSFMDIFDRVFLKVNLTVDNIIPAGKTINDNDKSLEINKFNNGHKKLVTTDMKNLKMKFTPISILFKDGSKLGSVNQ